MAAIIILDGTTLEDFYTATVTEVLAERNYVTVHDIIRAAASNLKPLMIRTYQTWSTRPPPRIESTAYQRTLLHLEARVDTRTAVVWILYGRTLPN